MNPWLFNHVVAFKNPGKSSLQADYDKISAHARIGILADVCDRLHLRNSTRVLVPMSVIVWVTVSSRIFSLLVRVRFQHLGI